MILLTNGSAQVFLRCLLFTIFLNIGFYKNLFKSSFTAYRTVLTIVDFLALAAMLALMYSGITLSRHVFAFLKIDSGLALARRLHILGSY